MKSVDRLYPFPFSRERPKIKPEMNGDGQRCEMRALTAAVTRQRLADAWLLPLSVLAMTVIAVQVLVWRWRGGPAWKARRYV